MHSRAPRGRRPIVFVLLLLAATAPLAQPAEDARPRTLLNSERIERTFGSYGVEVLKQEATLRVSNLFSDEPTGRVCRTFAVVRYVPAIDASFAAEHALIVDGGSIGAVFAQRGWTVERRHLFFGEVPATPKVAALMGGIAENMLAIHVYELVVSRGDVSLSYATIAEVHHPAHHGLRDLRLIHGATEEAPRAAAAEIIETTLREMR